LDNHEEEVMDSDSRIPDGIIECLFDDIILFMFLDEDKPILTLLL
jgi:hypothetical protein